MSRFYDRLTVTNSRTFYAAVSHKLSRVTLSRSLLNSISQLNWFNNTSRARFRAPDSSVTCRSHAGPAIGRSTQSAKTKKLTVNRGGQRPRKRPIKVRSTRKRSIESSRGTDCYSLVWGSTVGYLSDSLYMRSIQMCAIKPRKQQTYKERGKILHLRPVNVE